MTLLEWQTCTDPETMIRFVGGMGSERKWRLFATESCRQVWHLLTDERWRKFVETAELDAARTGYELIFELARRDAEIASLEYAEFISRGITQAIRAAQLEAEGGVLLELAISSLSLWEDWGLACALSAASACLTPNARSKRADILRDLFGPDPLRPVSIDLARITPKILCLAISPPRGDREHFHELGMALTHVGRHDPRIIAHCFEKCDHTSGCWVTDTICRMTQSGHWEMPPEFYNGTTVLSEN